MVRHDGQLGQFAVTPDRGSCGPAVERLSPLRDEERVACRRTAHPLGEPGLVGPQIVAVKRVRIVDSPFLSRSTCSPRLWRSTWCNFSAQASDTRSPWRNIKRMRQLSRNSVRLPRVAVIRRSTSRAARCLRSAIVLSSVWRKNAAQSRAVAGGGLRTLDKMVHFVQSRRAMPLNDLVASPLMADSRRPQAAGQGVALRPVIQRLPRVRRNSELRCAAFYDSHITV